METPVPNDVRELKRANKRIFILSVVFATIAIYLFLRSFLSNLKPADSMGGLAMLMLSPFLSMAFIFASNTLLYFLFLIYTKITNPIVTAKYTIDNSICFFGVLILLFVALYFFAGSILIILIIWPALILIVISAFYYKITVSLSKVGTSKVIKFSVITVLILIVAATASTTFFQYKINQLKTESNGGVQLSQEISTKDCRVYSLYEHQGTILSGKRGAEMNMAKFSGGDLSYSTITSKQTEYLGSLKLSDTEENTKRSIKEKSVSTNSVGIRTSYAIESGSYMTLYINIYDSITDTFSDYVMILAPGQRCFLF